jgi:O-antigen/teichoic acid export membrane protein
MHQFILNFFWSFLGIVYSSCAFFVGIILIGRALGPTEFGKYNLVLTISSMIVVFMSLGFDTTAIKYISGSKNKQEQRSYLSNSFWILCISGPIIFLISFLLSNIFSEIINTHRILIILASALSLVLAFKIMFDAFVKAFCKFKYQAFVKIIESSIFVFLTLFVLLKIDKQEYIYFLIPSALASLLAVILYGKIIIKEIAGWNLAAFKYSKNYLKLTLSVSFIGIIIGTIDRLFIAKFLGMNNLGIYSAYLMSIIIMSQLLMALSNVFFPMMNRETNKKQILRKIDRLMFFAFIPVLVCVSILSFIVLKIFGPQYEINFLYISLVSLISYLQIVTTFYGAIVSSSVKLFSFTRMVYYFKPIFMLALYYIAYTSENFQLVYVFFILACSYLYDIFNTKITFKFTAPKIMGNLTRT